MTVSFQGIKNVGVYSLKETDDITNKEETVFACINMELTDSYGKDLTNMESVIKRYQNPANKNFITLDYINSKRIVDSEEDVFLLNDKELPISDENLGTFEKLMKLFGKVLNTPKEELIVNRDFLTSDDCVKTFMKAFCFEITQKGGLFDGKQFIERLHLPKNVKKEIPDLMQIVQKSMIEYFK